MVLPHGIDRLATVAPGSVAVLDAFAGPPRSQVERLRTSASSSGGANSCATEALPVVDIAIPVVLEVPCERRRWLQGRLLGPGAERECYLDRVRRARTSSAIPATFPSPVASYVQVMRPFAAKSCQPSDAPT